MSITCYILDDQAIGIRVIRNFIQRTAGLSLVGTASDPEVALQELLLGNVRADITFMDIGMPGMSGLELAHALQGKTGVIFTTAHRQFGPEAFELKIIDYLLKPISYERFLKAIESAMDFLSKRREQGSGAPVPFIFVPGDGRRSWTKVMHGDILYIKAESNYVLIVLHGGTRLSYMSMEQALNVLPNDCFVRVHKSYIVNLTEVKEIEATSLELVNGIHLPIGRSYRDELTRRITNGW